MKKYNKILAVLGIILIMLFVVPFIINFIVTVETPFKLGFITIDNRGAWIGFFGSVLGGLLTLFGVWWTLEYQRKNNKRQLAIQYKPSLSLIDIKVEPGSTDIDTKGNSKTIDLKFTVEIENRGRGEATEIEIVDNECTPYYNKHSICFNTSYKREVESMSRTEIKFSLHYKFDDNIESIIKIHRTLLIGFDLQYKNLFKEKLYTLSIAREYDINVAPFEMKEKPPILIGK